MPRRQFQADLQKAADGLLLAAGISDVRPGADDGEFTFICMADGQPLNVSALITDVSEYPSSHTCMIFAGDNASAGVAAALNDITDAATAKTIPQILELVSSRLESTDGDGDSQMVGSQEFDGFEGYEDEDEDEDEEDYFPGDDDLLPKPRITHTSESCEPSVATTSEFRHRIRNDLLVAKSEGFKVGHLGGLMVGLGCYISLAIRISKLGISEEAMKAWQVEPSEYLVAICHYPLGYKSMDDYRSYDAHQARHNFGLRIGVSTTYKPTIQEAVAAFAAANKENGNEREDSQQGESQNTLPAQSSGFRNSFVSRPLNELFEQRFSMLLKYRYGGMPWQGAELFYNDVLLNSFYEEHDAAHDKYYEDERASTTWPRIVTADHITASVGQPHSLPLVGMQFVLRHFVRCTEFCLICFSKMSDDLQAIKPYVCDNPLCLYQYMSLGFGPSIEHEITSQPKVVDLLVSFCYSSARAGKLKEFPTGLSLAVPPPVSNQQGSLQGVPYHGATEQPRSVYDTLPVAAMSMRFNEGNLEMLFENSRAPCPVTPGSWVVIRVDEEIDRVMHCRVIDTSLYPSVKVSKPVVAAIADASNNDYIHPHTLPLYRDQAPQQTNRIHSKPVQRDHFRSGSFYLYDHNFDDLKDHDKQQAIVSLLHVLPPVEEMRKYLLRKSESPLSSWVDRLPSAALGVLRWIIASNRACILQVDEGDFPSGRKTEGRLYGMGGWAQFRFAMGAPDKERRFIEAVRQTKERLHLKYPTLFAWHGSPLHNWHSIIREGLHFKETHHGRAFGHGVYHAPNVTTSLGYSNIQIGASWPMSELKIQQALALNEIVNAPEEYVSQNPHLVVAQLDWIQTRYLFVRKRADVSSTAAPNPVSKPLEFVEQDPSRTPLGVDGPLIIPIHAIAASRRYKPTVYGLSKRQKASGKSRFDTIEVGCEDDDIDSVATLEEDLIIFDEDEYESDSFKPKYNEESIPTPNSIMDGKGKSKMTAISSFSSKIFGKSSQKAPQKPLTDYIPGTLDYSRLPMIATPVWATTSATKRLMKDFRDIISIQNREPLHELGWHIDEDKIDNIYQWIVELHSFDPKLPLAQDMKKRGIKSIVLELRFGKDHPMSPPFVRVIRPRFLGFNQGGGGHVTAGGAMCMELLTNDGWSAVSSIESVLLQVRMAICSVDPKPARLAPGGPSDYYVGEAVEAYKRACNVHGWTIPPGFNETASGGLGTANPY